MATYLTRVVCFILVFDLHVLLCYTKPVNERNIASAGDASKLRYLNYLDSRLRVMLVLAVTRNAEPVK